MPNFVCFNCKKTIVVSVKLGTRHRNHCPHCLFSRHLDKDKPGDRLAHCGGSMEPKAISFKRENNKYAKDQRGELMVVHRCTECGQLSRNRLAGDDNIDEVLRIFAVGTNLSDELLDQFKDEDIQVAVKADEKAVRERLFGRSRV